MKKIISLMLVIVMALLLFACGAEEAAGGDKDQPEGNEEKKVEISRGTIEEGVYKNEYLGIKFVSTDSWTYCSDREIAELTDLVIEDICGENFSQTLKNNEDVYDMMAINATTGANIIVGYENLEISNSLNFTISMYVRALEIEVSKIENMSVTFPAAHEKVKLGDTEFTRVIATANLYGVSTKQVYYFRKADGYMSYIIITLPNDSKLEHVERMFKPYSPVA